MLMYVSCLSKLGNVKSPGQWNKLDMVSTSGKEDQLFKYLDKFRYLGIEDLPQQIFIEGFTVKVQFLENKTGEITAGRYL